MPSTTARTTTSRAPNIIAWILQILLAIGFLAAAGAKFAGVPMMVDTFAQIGVGQWFRYVTATVEIVGALGLLIPRTTALAALLLAVTMVGATIAHLAILHTTPAPALVLFVLCLTVAWLRRATLQRSFGHRG